MKGWIEKMLGLNEPERREPVAEEDPAEWPTGRPGPLPPITESAHGALLETLTWAETLIERYSGPPHMVEQHVGRLRWLRDRLDFEHQIHANALPPDMVHCVPPEDHARIHNAGYALAAAHGLADDPLAADEWLTSHIASMVDLEPFREILTEVEARRNAFGGGVQAAYANVSDMLRRALARYAPRT